MSIWLISYHNYVIQIKNINVLLSSHKLQNCLHSIWLAEYKTEDK